MTLVVVSPGEGSDEAGTVIVSAKRKAKEFEYRFVHLLAQTGDYIRRCPECATIFFAIRRDQLYCQPRCQNRVAARKWREPERPRGDERRAAVARKAGKDRGITQRKGREGWWVVGRERASLTPNSLVWTKGGYSRANIFRRNFHQGRTLPYERGLTDVWRGLPIEALIMSGVTVAAGRFS
jgi:hypothetical protein